MACTCPLSVWPASPDAADRRVVFSSFKSYAGARSKLVPCGQCTSCRLTKAQHWATRILHEAQMRDASCFATLTYASEHLPHFGQLRPHDVKLFVRRVVERFGPTRYFLVGELGDTDHRPHYHVILFGVDFAADRRLWRKTDKGHPVYRSPTLEGLWPFGLSEFGDVTIETAEYCGRYSMKKINGDRREDAAAISLTDPHTGEVIDGTHFLPFCRMSRRPGIGASWLEKYHRDVFPSDFLIVNGAKRGVPPFYVRHLSDMEKLKLRLKRMAAGRAHADNNTDRRLMARTESRDLKAARLKRDAAMDVG